MCQIVSFVLCNPLPVVELEDRSVATGTDQTLTCTIRGLSQETAVTWIDPDNNKILDSDTSNYVIDQGVYAFGSKASTLTIRQAKLSNLAVSSVFKCQLSSSRYPLYSPPVEKSMTLTLIGLSKFLKRFCFVLFSLINTTRFFTYTIDMF